MKDTKQEKQNSETKKYDVFVSYRRERLETARSLVQALEKRGLRVFFDLEELDDGDFNEELYDAIDQSKNAIFLMTEGALDGCVRVGDWVRNELEHVLLKEIKLILVNPSDVTVSFPDTLPQSLQKIKKIQVTKLDLGTLFNDSVNKIVKRLEDVRLAGQKADDALPVLGKAVDEVSLTGLTGQDAKHFKKALGYYKVLLRRSALAELQKIEKQDDPIVRYYVLRFTYELEGTVSEHEFEEACCAARDRGCTDAMVAFAARHLTNEDILFDSTPASECLEWLNKAIAGGNAEAFLTLASAYEHGKGVKKAPARASALYRQASESGGMQEKMVYGLELLTGDSCEKDASGAVKILRPFLKHLVLHEDELTSYEFVLLAVSNMYNPIGVKDQDLRRIEKYLASAIGFKGRLIEDEMFVRCGAYCALGRVILENDEKGERAKEAFDSYTEAYRLGDKEGNAEFWLGCCHENGWGVEPNRDIAFKYFNEAVSKDNSAAQRKMAMHLFEEGEDQDIERGKMLLKLSAEGGDADGEHAYGLCLIRGIYFERNVSEGMKWLEKSAAKDEDAGAMNSLGEMYRDGDESVPVDQVKAFKWFRRGAEAGSADAMVSLGLAYLSGQGTIRDVAEAEKWFKKAAKTGDADAECSLGTRFFNGEFGSRDVDEAIKWWERAAEHGDTVAMQNLGTAYRDGDGVDKDLHKAEEWFVRAAEAGSGDAACTLGAAYYRGDFGETDKKKALEWSLKAAKLGDLTAMNNLGITYRDGDGVEMNLARAIEWFRRAADGGHPDAMANLGFAYLNGTGVLKDVKEAEAWFVKAAETGDADAEVSLGTRYAQGAFGKVDYPKAVEWWLKAARNGQIVAQWNLGDVYQRGEEGVKKDLPQSFDWFKESAEAGFPDAMESLGLAYLGGLGTIADEEKAKEWLTRAAELGNVSAICSMGTRFAQGAFGERDMHDAIKWWERAAAHGDTVAMENLGVTYRDGDGVDKDLHKAEEWFVRAAEAGSGDAACTLGAAYYRGDFGETDKKKALEWSLKAAKLGDLTAMNNLGITYRDGDGVEMNLARAIEWFRQAANRGHPGAMTNLGFAYLNGDGVAVDKKAAEEWFVRAAETGDADAECALGTRYAQGAFGKVDYVKAKEWWEKAAEQNYLIAMWSLGDMYQFGEDGVPQDRILAFIWFKRAAEAGLPDAMESLGLAYLQGWGTIADPDKAKEWLIRAAENGNSSAECTLGSLYARDDYWDKDLAETVKWWTQAAEHGDATAMGNLGRLFSDSDLKDDVIHFDLEKARKWFHDADEAGNEDAAYFLGLDVLSAMGKRHETYSDWQKEFMAANPEAGAARRILRKAGSWFHKPMDAQTDNASLAGACLRWLARIARYQEDLEKAKDLYCQAAEKGDEKAKKELAELESGGVVAAATNAAPEVSPAVPKAPVPAMATSVEPPKPETVPPSVVQTPVGDEASRAEALFLRKARRLKKNDGRIDPNEKLELRELAAELSISVLRREELIEQVEEEFEAGV